MDSNKENLFKKGSQYSRKDVGWVLLPETGRPAGGTWDTGYVRVENKLIIFDGLTYHASTTPTTTPRRVAINFNYR